MKLKILFVCILLAAAFLRFYNTNWDQGNHLHPDERFLTMVGTAMVLPSSFADYLNPATSKFNPANIGQPFYVYGTLPVALNKLLAATFHLDNYTDFTILGRVFSGFADLLVVFFIYKILELFEKRFTFNHSIKYWGSFFYAIAVLPIQLSHFFTVDTFQNLFSFSAFYFLLRFYFSKNLLFILVSAVLFGLAIGSKISTVYIVPLLLFFIIKPYFPFEHHVKKSITIYNLLSACFLFGVTAYIAGRIADPYLFQNGTNFLDPHPNKLFLENLKSLQSWSNPEAWFPPSVQWINKTPVLYALINIVVFGVGVVYALLAVLGSVYTFAKYKHLELRTILIWVFLFFLYQSIQFSKTMRYFLPLYPFLAMFAAVGYYELTKHWTKLAKGILLFFVIIWPLMFFSIYTKNHSRTTASKWIYQFIPTNSVLLSEHWDDALPLPAVPPSDKKYTIEQLPVFGPDEKEKWDTMNAMLNRGDFLILSSNRGWGSIPTVPKRYPKMTKFYEDLFAGKTNYKKVAEFTSYPSLSYLGIPLTFPDDWSEEAFTVYDHPKVVIFKHVSK